MSRKRQIAQKVVNLSEQIAVGYMDVGYVEELIGSENGLLYLSSKDQIKEYSEFEQLNASDINAYLIAKRYETFSEFNKDVEYGDVISNSEYDESKMFPSLNLRSVSVEPQSQGQNLGTKLATYALTVANQNDNYPVIARMWKKANGKNGHIRTVRELLNGNIIGENEDFLSQLECNICGVRDCDCSEVYIVLENNNK